MKQDIITPVEEAGLSMASAGAGADGLLDCYAAAYARLDAFLAAHPGQLSIATLGPEGTSSHTALLYLLGRLIERDRALGTVRTMLYPSFDDVLRTVVDGTARVALLPNAYPDVTSFYWHEALRLLFFFSSPTPSYGLVTRAGRALGAGPLTIASCQAVVCLLDELCPPALRGRELTWRIVDSTQAAAAAAAEDPAVDLAITNEHGAAHHSGLRFLSRRAGVDMVWSLFVRKDEVER